MLGHETDEFSADPLARPVLEYLKNKKWRKARDEAKTLVKTKGASYTPLLAAANIGLFREMVERNLLSDAKTVLDYLQTIAAPEVVADLAALLASARSKTAAAPAAPSPPSPPQQNHWRDVWQKVAAAASVPSAVPSAETIRAVDEVVASFQAPPQIEGADPVLVASIARELAAVQSACDAAGDGRWEEMADLLKAVPSTSIFRHWRFFLRGVRHWFAEDITEARACFARIPPGGGCAVAAQVLVGERSKDEVTLGSLVEWDLAVTGYPERWAPAITNASENWGKGKFKIALLQMLKAMGTDLGVDWNGLASCLRHTLFRSCLAAGQKYYDQCMELISCPPVLFEKVIACEFAFSSLECDAEMDRDGLWPDNWKSSVGMLCSIHKNNRVLKSVALTTGAENLANILKGPSPFGMVMRASKVRFKNIVELLERALAEWPGNRTASELLVDIVDQGRGRRFYDDAKLRQVLENAVASFPEHKPFLVRAGLVMMRVDSAKAVGYLEKAHRIDPLDAVVAQNLVIGYVRMIRHRMCAREEKERLWAAVLGLIDRADGKAGLLHYPKTGEMLKVLSWGRVSDLAAVAEQGSVCPHEFNMVAAVLIHKLDAKCLRRDPFYIDAATDPSRLAWDDIRRILDRFYYDILADVYLDDKEPVAIFLGQVCDRIGQARTYKDPKGLFRLVRWVDALAAVGRNSSQSFDRDFSCAVGDFFTFQKTKPSARSDVYHTYLYYRFAHNFSLETSITALEAMLPKARAIPDLDLVGATDSLIESLKRNLADQKAAASSKGTRPPMADAEFQDVFPGIMDIEDLQTVIEDLFGSEGGPPTRAKKAKKKREK